MTPQPPPQTLYVVRYSLPCPHGHLHHFALVFECYTLAVAFWTAALFETSTATLTTVLPDGRVQEVTVTPLE